MVNNFRFQVKVLLAMLHFTFVESCWKWLRRNQEKAWANRRKQKPLKSQLPPLRDVLLRFLTLVSSVRSKCSLWKQCRTLIPWNLLTRLRIMLRKFSSRKHAYIILTLLNRTFYITKLGFTGVYIIFLFLLKNRDCGYSLEPPHRGGSNGYPQSVFWAEIWKMSEFLSESFQFLVVKFSIYLNRRVFVMWFLS